LVYAVRVRLVPARGPRPGSFRRDLIRFEYPAR
jgi:hypothetical protein